MTGSGAAMTLSQSNAASKPSPAQRRLAVYQSPCPMTGGPPGAWSRSRAAQPDSSIQAGPFTSFRSMSRSSGHGHRSVPSEGDVHGGAGSSVSNSSGFGARATRWTSASANGSGHRPETGKWSPPTIIISALATPSPKGTKSMRGSGHGNPRSNRTRCAAAQATRRSDARRIFTTTCGPEISLIPMTADRWPKRNSSASIPEPR